MPDTVRGSGPGRLAARVHHLVWGEDKKECVSLYPSTGSSFLSSPTLSFRLLTYCSGLESSPCLRPWLRGTCFKKDFTKLNKLCGETGPRWLCWQPWEFYSAWIGSGPAGQGCRAQVIRAPQSGIPFMPPLCASVLYSISALPPPGQNK